METYCVSFKRNTGNENSSVKKHRLMLSSNYAVCGKKKTIFIKNKELNRISND